MILTIVSLNSRNELVLATEKCCVLFCGKNGMFKYYLNELRAWTINVNLIYEIQPRFSVDNFADA